MHHNELYQLNDVVCSNVSNIDIFYSFDILYLLIRQVRCLFSITIQACLYLNEYLFLTFHIVASVKFGKIRQASTYTTL